MSAELAEQKKTQFGNVKLAVNEAGSNGISARAKIRRRLSSRNKVPYNFDRVLWITRGNPSGENVLGRLQTRVMQLATRTLRTDMLRIHIRIQILLHIALDVAL